MEAVTAALAESDERLAEEAADLVFHLYVLLAARGVDLAASTRRWRAAPRPEVVERRGHCGARRAICASDGRSIV